MTGPGGETTIFATRLHWVMIAGPATLMVIAGLSIGQKGSSAALVLALAVVWGIFSSISYELSEIVLTRRDISVRVGFPWRRRYNVSMTDVADVTVYQPSLGKVLDFGKITIRRKNGKRISVRMVASPHLLAREVYRCMEEAASGG